MDYTRLKSLLADRTPGTVWVELVVYCVDDVRMASDSQTNGALHCETVKTRMATELKDKARGGMEGAGSAGSLVSGGTSGSLPSVRCAC